MGHLERLPRLQRKSIYAPYAFDRVTVMSSHGNHFSILGKVYSEFKSGPNLVCLADCAAEITGKYTGFYGLESCRFLGWTN